MGIYVKNVWEGRREQVTQEEDKTKHWETSDLQDFSSSFCHAADLPSSWDI